MNAVCDHNNFYHLLWMGYVVDGRPGGFVLGQSHEEGHIYMLRQEEHKYYISECLEGVNLPRYCGQSEKLLQQQMEDSHGIEEEVVHPRI